MYSSAFTITDLEPELKCLFSVWKSACDVRFPRLSELGLPNIEPAPNILSVYEIERSGSGDAIDFKALYERSRIAGTLSSKIVGTRLSDHPGMGEGSRMWSSFVEVATNPRPLWVSLPYVGPLEGYQSTSEIYLPMLDDRGNVEYLLIGVVLLDEKYGTKLIG